MIHIRSNAIFTGDPKHRTLVDGSLVIEGGTIQALLPQAEWEARFGGQEHEVHDHRGRLLSPGLIDAHTHLLFAGHRANELAMKLAGQSYMDIHHAGGGIHATVRATRAASDASLYAAGTKRLHAMLLHGTCTVEAKSGYGLDTPTELRLLKLAATLHEEGPMDVIPTYMGAHAVPREMAKDKEGFIKRLIEEELPAVAETGLTAFCDIFCEEGIFSIAESRRLGLAAKALGFQIKLHADEIVPMGGAALAAELGAISAEHLMAIRESDIPLLKAAGTVPVLLPATSFFLMSPRYAPAKAMLAAGLEVALASDFNPGSSPCENLQMAMFLACFQMQMSPYDIFLGVTSNAAKAIGLGHSHGRLEAGMVADVTVLDVPSLEDFFYHFGVNHVTSVYKSGIQVVEDGRLHPERFADSMTAKATRQILSP